MNTLDQKLEDVIQRRKKITETLDRLKGRQEQAQSNLEAVEEECRAKKIDPEKIEDIIKQLEAKYSKIVSELAQDVEEAEQKIEPYLTGNNNS